MQSDPMWAPHPQMDASVVKVTDGVVEEKETPSPEGWQVSSTRVMNAEFIWSQSAACLESVA